MSNTLVSVITMARPRRAIFTTFTFSLSWFEALVLPALRQCNCEQIDVLVDARQACKSTDEAASLYAGSAYRVIPVFMERTAVFHPKLAYLEGWEDLDHLVVASANLTMSGHGRNLEVIDALSSDTEPAVFGEFGDFLQALTAKYSFSAESLDVLHAYPEGRTKVKLSMKVIVGAQDQKALDRDPDYEPNPGANFLQAVQYRPSIINGMPCLKVTGVQGAYLLTDAGEKLADAYEEAIAKHPRRDWLADIGKQHVSDEDVAEMGGMLDLLNPSQGEIDAFIEQYYPESPDGLTLGPNWEYRQQGLTLALRAIYAEQKTRKYKTGVPENVIRFAMARGRTHDGLYVLALNDCAQAQSWWASLQLRQYLRIAQGVLLRLCESWVHRAVVTNKPREILDCAHGLGEKLLTLLPENTRQDVASLIKMMEDWRGNEPTLYAAGPRLEYEQRIESLLDSLLSVRYFAHNSDEEEQALRSAYVALLYCASEARNFRTDPDFAQALENERLTLEKLADVMLAHMHDSPAAFMAHVVQHYVLLQHFGIVQERAARDGRSRYVLLKGDLGLERTGNGEEFVSIDLLEDRLRHALLLAAQCDLLVQNEEAGTFSLTPEGLRRLHTVAV